MKTLVLTNLFPTPWDPLRGTFNSQQFERLGQRLDIDVLTAVDFRQRLAGVRGTVKTRALNCGYFVFVYPPLIGRSLHAACWALSLWLQRGRQIRRANYDSLLVSWAYPDGVAAGWLARRLRIPYVVKVHGSDLNVQAEHALRRRQIRIALQGAGAVIAVSRALAEKAIALGADEDRVHVIYNGVDTDLFSRGSRDAARSELHLAPDALLVLFVGNLKAGKGCLDLLEAFPLLLAAQPRAQLVFVGTGACREELLARAAVLGCAAQVTLVGGVAHEALGTWFRAADLLCLPSHNEGVPNVVLEAMACGIPIVATAVGGIPEVVPGFAGLLVPPRQREALATALVSASRQPWDSERIANHAGSFRWDDNVARLENILRGVAAEVQLLSELLP